MMLGTLREHLIKTDTIFKNKRLHCNRFNRNYMVPGLHYGTQNYSIFSPNLFSYYIIISTLNE